MENNLTPLLCPTAIFSIGIFVMLCLLQVRRRVYMPKGEPASAEVDSWTGVIILIIGAIVFALISNSAEKLGCTISEPGKIKMWIDAISDLGKVLFGALGAMYLKNGYEKHDEEWQKNHRGAPENLPNKTTIFFHQETSTTQASRDEESKGQP